LLKNTYTLGQIC